LKLAARSKAPDWSVEVAYNSAVPLLKHGVDRRKHPFAAVYRCPGPRRRESGSTRQVETLYEDTLRQHQAELKVNFEDWRSLQRRAQSLNAALIPLTNDRVAQTLASYAGGTATLTQVFEARRAAADARMQVLLLERDAARAWAKVNFQFADPASHAHVLGVNP
jgi:hypothetical protein